MRLPFGRSLRFRVVLVILATTLAALLVSTAALVLYEARSYRDAAVTDATTQADIIARSSAPALVFADPDAAAANLALLETRQRIDAAAIYTRDGELFATYTRGGADVPFPALPRHMGPQIDGDMLRLFHPVVEEGERIGVVYLQVQYDVAARLYDMLLILGVVLLISLAAAAAVSLRLQRGVTAPVQAVASVARKVVEERDFSLRVSKATDDELGVLVDSFNAMLAELGQRTAAMEATNRQLLAETEERRAAEAALREADRRKDEFLAVLAHELRNPLAPMVNALSLIRMGASEDVRRRAEEIIRRQLSHMVRLVDDLLDVSRMTTNKLAVRRAPTELAPIVRSAIDTAQPVIEAQEHALTVELPEQPVRVDADPVRLSQVLANLLNNAARYTPPCGKLALRVSVTDGRVRIRVTDNGSGIAPAVLPTVFDMFTQGDTSLERQQSGLGVGLALSRRLVELHGGTIEAHSDGIGLGSTFVIDLPLAVSAKGVAAARAGGAAEPR